MLLHLVDGTAEDVAASYRTVRAELVEYGGGLANKPEIVVLNKIDALTKETITERHAALRKASKHEVVVVSGVAGTGVPELMRAALKEIDAAVDAAVPLLEREAIEASRVRESAIGDSPRPARRKASPHPNPLLKREGT